MSEALSLYIHYPFCKSKCPYCDFNSHVNKEVKDDEFTLAYLKELEYFAAKLKNRTIKTIFFGGGTPSLMKVDLVEKILDKISDLWVIDKNTEITLEANPTSFESEKFLDFKKSGINRLSIGIQALNDIDLKFLGRQHSAREAIETIKTASKFFDNYSFDLIYARPNQTLKNWENELKQAIKLSPNHLSLYQLTIEKGTKFYAMHKNKEFQIPHDELAANFYELTNEITINNGLELYEISNYAKPGWQCRHNLVYWQSQDYLGIGAGAHSRVLFDGAEQRSRIMLLHDPKNWQNSILKNDNSIQEIAQINQNELLEEITIMGLRLASGIDNKIFQQHLGKDYQELFSAKKLEFLVREDLIEMQNNNIRISKKGRILTNSIIEKLLN